MRPKDQGEYKVTISVDDCVSEFSESITVLITEIEEHQNKIALHPNPATRLVDISLPQTNGTKFITLISSQGKEIENLTTDESSIQVDVATFPAGVYL